MKRDDYQFNQTTPAFFIQGPSLFARFVFLAILAIALIITDSRLQYLKAFRTQVETYLHPLSLMANAPMELFGKADYYLKSQQQLLDENKALRNKLLKANVDVQSVHVLQRENDQLRNLSKLASRHQQKQILAEILHATSNQSVREIVINRGTAHHVELGAAIIDANGVVGQVTRLYPQTSLVTLITNPAMEIPVMVARNGLRAIAFGKGHSNLLEIPFLPANIDIKVGDQLVTSGIDFVYPPGFAIGRVETINVEPGAGYIRIHCSVAGGVDFNRHVMVVNPMPQSGIEDPQYLEEETTQAEKQIEPAVGRVPYRSQGVIRVSD